MDVQIHNQLSHEAIQDEALDREIRCCEYLHNFPK